MAARCHPFFPSVPPLLLNLLVVSLASAHGASIATYWGRNQKEGTLSKACSTGNYDYINIGFLTRFGSGQTPVLDLSGHCNAARGGCVGLARDIKACQKRGIKVLLSLGGETGQRSSLNSTVDALEVAQYLYNSFLGGGSPSRPFGGAVLDGIDFSVTGKAGKDPMHWEDLARALASQSSAGRKVYLAAAPRCAYPDKTLRRALATGLFDIAWIRFYGHASCQYSPADPVRLKMSWEKWNAKLPVGEVLIGLPASGGAAESGYVPPRNFTRDVLPFISAFPKYGGIMLWDRYYDMMNKYSDEVKYDIKFKGDADRELSSGIWTRLTRSPFRHHRSRSGKGPF